MIIEANKEFCKHKHLRNKFEVKRNIQYQIAIEPTKTPSPCWAKGTCADRRPQVRQAFRSKARLWHPDRGGDPERCRVPGGRSLERRGWSQSSQMSMGHHYMYRIPIGSMGLVFIYTHIYHENQPNVGKYTIHGWYI